MPNRVFLPRASVFFPLEGGRLTTAFPPGIVDPVKEVLLMKKNSLYLSVFFILFLTTVIHAGDYRLQSPDKRLDVHITTSDKIYYSLFYDDKLIVKPSPLSLTLYPDRVLGKNPGVKKTRARSVDEKLFPTVPRKNAVIIDRFNELTITFKGDFGVVFRAYDDGAAYRFTLNMNGTVKVKSEEVNVTFAGNHHVYFPTETGFFSHQERLYDYIPLANIAKETFASLPALVDIKDGPRVLIAEADLDDYPGMYLRGNNNTSLTGLFPGFPLKEEGVDLSRRNGDRSIRVLEYADYIAKISGKRALPWRVLIAAGEDAALVNSEMIFKLAQPLQLKDTSWIKPGKVAWDWWNFNNIYGVDFRFNFSYKQSRSKKEPGEFFPLALPLEGIEPGTPDRYLSAKGF
jgi:alpha-glucosidase